MNSLRDWSIRCIKCGTEFETEPASFLCTRCGEILELLMRRHLPDANTLFARASGSGVWRYSKALPFRKNVTPVTLGEGGTPLIRSTRLGERLGLDMVFVKNEGQNPSGSFKDRGMTVAITRARERGAKVLLCASTGNTSASLAAYAARASMEAVVVVPSGKVAAGKLVQAVVYGAKIVRVDGDFDRTLSITMKVVSENPHFYLMNSVNPFRIEGQKTAAFEIYEQLGGMIPDLVVLPVGNAGNISAYWKGFNELRKWGMTKKVPRMIGVQAAGAAPIAEAYSKSEKRVKPWKDPKTVASAIRIGNPVSWRKALAAIQESHGASLAVMDEEIMAARNELASNEGIFVEAASAAPIAALPKIRKMLGRDSTVVCIATGNGLKDQESVRVEIDRAAIASDARSLLRAIAS